MTTAIDHPAAPSNLQTAGATLWNAILADLPENWQPDAREYHLLERACRIEDEMRMLEAIVDAEGPAATGSTGQVVIHPALLEGRQLKIAQLRLLSAIEMTKPSEDEPRTSTPAQLRARHAGNASWSQPGGRRSRG